MASLLANAPGGFHIQYIDDIAVLVLNNTENRFNINSVQQILDALEEVERNDSVNALIIIGVGKVFTNGLDLDWLLQQPSDIGFKFFKIFKDMLFKLCIFPVPTIAALNGHTFGAGCVFALLCDCRVMRTNKGWICLPNFPLEVQVRLQFAMTVRDLIRLKVPSPQVVRDMVIFAKRFTAEEAYKVGLVEAICEESQLLDCAFKLARQCLGKNGFIDRAVVKTMKMDLYGNVLEQSFVKDQQRLNTRINKIGTFEEAVTSKL